MFIYVNVCEMVLKVILELLIATICVQYFDLRLDFFCLVFGEGLEYVILGPKCCG